MQGDLPMIILVTLLGFALITLLISRRPFMTKIGMLAHFFATIFLFGMMIYTFPEAISLKFRDTAPILAALILLVNNVVLLLLWNQLQKQTK